MNQNTSSKKDLFDIKTFCYEANGVRVLIGYEQDSKFVCMGGCRIWDYKTLAEQETDLNRLVNGMSLKSRWAGLKLGGGKMNVCILKPVEHNLVLQTIAQAINSLNGKYVTAEDVGTTESDMAKLSELSKWVVGRPEKSGDPAPWTALGVFLSIKACFQYRDQNLKNKTVGVFGHGNVGKRLAYMLKEAGCMVDCCDLNLDKINSKDFEVVSHEQMMNKQYDVFAPCAMGGVINADYLNRPNAFVVCGAANNQLVDDSMAQSLFDKNILYVPDAIANAGGIINVASELWTVDEGERIEEVRRRVQQIYPRTLKLLHESAQQNLPPLKAAYNWLGDKNG